MSVCNALDCLLLHRSHLADLQDLLADLATTYHCEVYADKLAYAQLNGQYPAELLHRATAESFGTEFLRMALSIKVIDDIDAAIAPRRSLRQPP